MIRRWIIVAPLTIALAVGVASTAQKRVDALREQTFDQELLYLPNEKLLVHFTGGLNSVIADVLWLQCIQYTGQEFRGDAKFVWLDHMGNTITRLDPHFLDVYRYVGMFLASLKADDAASLEFLQQGIIRNPHRWELPYEAAFIYLLNRREQPGAAEMGGEYLRMAVETGTAPESVTLIAQGQMKNQNLVDVEREMWASMLDNSQDEIMRELATRQLALLEIRVLREELVNSVAAFTEARGEPPTELVDLFAARGEVPSFQDVLGGTFFLDAQGEVQNTTLLDEQLAKTINRIQSAIRRYTKDEGQAPASLQDLINSEQMTKLPSHPYDGQTWIYDPSSGEVTSSPVE
jgi:hypothetical protein